MLPDEIQFVVVLYLIYLSDCFILPRTTALLLYTRFSGLRLRVKTTERAAVFGGRFCLLRPFFPPLGFSRSLELPRGSFGLEGFCSASSAVAAARAGEELRYVRYDDIQTLEVRDEAFIVNGVRWFKDRAADRLKENVETLRKAADRPIELRRLVERGYGQAVEASAALAAARARVGGLELCCSLYAVLMLIGLPALLFRLPPSALLWYLGVPILALHLLCGLLFLRAHAALLKPDRWHRWESFLKMFFCPPMMLRACDGVVDHIRLEADPLALLLACVEEQEWRPVVRRVWRRLHPFRRSGIPDDAALAIEEYAAVYRAALEKALRKQGVDPGELAIDAAAIPKGQAVCPCCEAVYRNEIVTCTDCGDVPLLKGSAEE